MTLRYLARALALASLCAVAAAPAVAQTPFGPQSPTPTPGQFPQCTKDYLARVEEQIKSLEGVIATGPEMVAKICGLIDMGAAALGGELPDGLRSQLKDLLGVDIDFRFLKTQCRQSQGDLDRELRTQLGFFRAELQRCNRNI